MMRRSLRPLTLSLTAILLFGCVCSAQKPEAFTKPDGSTFTGTKLTTYEAKVNEYLEARRVGNSEKARLARNDLIFETKRQVDKSTTSYWRKRQNGNRFGQLFLEIAELAAASAIVISNGERVKTLIGQGLSFEQSGRSLINKRLQLDILIGIQGQGERNQAEQFTRVNEKLPLSDSDFSWAQAKDMLQTYMEVGKYEPALRRFVSGNENAKSNEEQKQDTSTLLSSALSNLLLIQRFKTGAKPTDELATLQDVYNLISVSEALSPLLMKIPTFYGSSPTIKDDLEKKLRIVQDGARTTASETERLGAYTAILERLAQLALMEGTRNPAILTSLTQAFSRLAR